jgi:hypothetical protein
MIPPDDDVLAALARLDNNTDFAAVKGWFLQNLAEAHKSLETERDEVPLRQAQGQAQLMTDFLSRAKSARDVMEKKRILGGEHP